ncbi:MAG: phosphatidylglycerol lysyltransferase domain-containing protein [Clostridiales bacterium]|uniref:DUF2156 domain-containing protein n=1 Tax=Flavonifractor porci TaxID=3133422 RepID=UPI0030B287E0|nr:phosphatidylglycerol lysyltransferase domain-containing protein [Clostridiales bacterium]
MQFKQLTLNEVPLVQPCFRQMRSRTCDFTVGGMFMWRNYYKMEYAMDGGIFYSRLHDQDGQVYYNLPLGGDMAAGIEELKQLTAGGPLRFCTVPECDLEEIQAICPGCTVSEQTDFADYLYQASDLARLAGKRYSGQRNQISQFKRGVEGWSFEPLTAGNLGAVEAFFTQTYLSGAGAGDTEREENRRVLEVLQNLDRYGMVGGVLTADGSIVGFSLGEIVNDTLFTHIEKADRSCKGAYQMLVNQFAAAYAGENVTYINREEDMGDPGLRRAKQAYHPIELLKKYVVEVM